MTPFIIFLIVVTILVLVAALGVLIYRKRWWPVVFLLCIIIAFIVLAYYLPTRTLVTATGLVVTQDALGDTTLFVPIYVIILAFGIMFLIITMVAGSVTPVSESGGIGAVGGLILAFVFGLVAVMPSIYVWYRVFVQASVVLTLGMLMGSTVLALLSSAFTNPFMRPRRYGCQTVSHVLYYFSLGALSTAAANCDSVDDIFTLIAVSVLSSATATLGIIVESNAWNI